MADTFNENLASAIKDKNLENVFNLLKSAQEVTIENILSVIQFSNNLGAECSPNCNSFDLINLVFETSNINDMVKSKGRDILLTVLELDDIESLKHLLKKFPPLLEIVKTKIGPFETAATYGHIDIVTYLWTFPEIQQLITKDDLEEILELTEDYVGIDIADEIRNICTKPKMKPSA